MNLEHYIHWSDWSQFVNPLTGDMTLKRTGVVWMRGVTVRTSELIYGQCYTLISTLTDVHTNAEVLRIKTQDGIRLLHDLLDEPLSLSLLSIHRPKRLATRRYLIRIAQFTTPQMFFIKVNELELRCPQGVRNWEKWRI